MKKRISLQVLVSLILLPVLPGLLSTCKNLGYQPTLKGINISFYDLAGNQIDESKIPQNDPITIVISCVKPSSVKDEDVSITLSYTGLTLPSYSSGITIRGQQTIRIDNAKVTGSSATITVTAEPGGVSASWTITPVPGGGALQRLRLTA